jgi:hypothetical protein
MKPKGIFCLEGLWDNDLENKSTVHPMLNMLEINGGIPFIHQNIATIHELEFYLGQWKKARYRPYPILYLAFHGKNEVLVIGKAEYSLDQLAEVLCRSCKNSLIFLASCNSMQAKPKILYRFLNQTHALALCGYKGEVNWMMAAAFEFLFLLKLQEATFSRNGIITIKEKLFFFKHWFTELEFRIVTKMELNRARLI